MSKLPTLISIIFDQCLGLSSVSLRLIEVTTGQSISSLSLPSSMASSTPTSEQNQPHPRRTSQRMLPRSLSVASDDPNISSLQKSGTFHSPTTLSSTLYDPLQDVKPKRSNTDLDCFANLTGEPDKRVVAILDSYDKSAAGDAHLFQNTFDERDVLPVPYVTLGHSSAVPDPSRMKGDQVLDTEHHHVSDSGIGTSIETGACR